MPLSLQKTVEPATEPLTLTEAKLHLRVDATDDDSLITSLITVAREMVETATNRQIVSATWKLSMDCFPSGWSSHSGRLIEDQGGLRYSDGLRQWQGNVIKLPRSPVASVSSVTYVDPNGATQTLSSSLYQL